MTKFVSPLPADKGDESANESGQEIKQEAKRRKQCTTTKEDELWEVAKKLFGDLNDLPA